MKSPEEWLKGWERENVTLKTSLSRSTSFRFPLQSELARQEILWGAFLLITLNFVGWLLNMGHRIQMVHNMHHGKPAWPAWVDYRSLLRHGVITFLGMVYYYTPGALAIYFGYLGLGVTSLVLATLAIPGYMTHYCKRFDIREIFNPFLALSRAFQGGIAYWQAWGIALQALAISFLGLPLGLGFFASSVWFWQVAGFSFATCFTQKFRLSTER